MRSMLANKKRAEEATCARECSRDFPPQDFPLSTGSCSAPDSRLACLFFGHDFKSLLDIEF
jgi:hypothetical protein